MYAFSLEEFLLWFPSEKKKKKNIPSSALYFFLLFCPQRTHTYGHTAPVRSAPKEPLWTFYQVNLQCDKMVLGNIGVEI